MVIQSLLKNDGSSYSFVLYRCKNFIKKIADNFNVKEEHYTLSRTIKSSLALCTCFLRSVAMALRE